MVINRDIYLNRLIAHKNNGMIKIITGIRRCGKSFLLNRLFYEHLLGCGIDDKHIIKFSFEDDADLRAIGEDIIDLHIKKRKVNPYKFSDYIRSLIKDDGPYYILLDEVQQLEAFETVLNGFLRQSNWDVYVTGSNSKFLSSDIITEFRGRGDEIRVYPLCFSEYFSLYKNSTDFESAWLSYCIYGGMPQCATMSDAKDKTQYLTNLFSSTYIADIINRRSLRGNAEINELTDILASSIGTLTNPLKLSNTFASDKKTKISTTTVTNYLEYLQDSFLIEKAVRYDIKGKKYINTPSKYYFVDMGLRNARLSFRQSEYTHIMENVIYNELRLRGYSVDVGIVETAAKSGRTQERKQLEVDFVVNLGNRRYYIQSAYAMPTEEKLKQEQAPLLAIGDAFRKVIIVNQSILTGYNEQGILIISLSDFLNNPESALNY